MIKQTLFSLCVALTDERITSATQAIHLVQSSANEETKSSAGDKYETGRAMAQLEIEKFSTQLAEALNQKRTLARINPLKETTVAQTGSLIFTNQGNYYIAISAGKLVVEGTTYFVISPVSPLGSKLMGLKASGRILFNKKELIVERIT